MNQETSPSDTIRIMLVDDHAMVRNGLRTFLLVYDDLDLVGEAADGHEALAVYTQVDPDVVLMDLKMPRMDGVETTRALLAHDPDACVIALTSFKEEELVTEALDAGARGYLLKDIGAEELAKAIRTAHAGNPALASEAAWALFTASRRGPKLGDDLTDRELEVLALMAEGKTNPEIAAALFLGLSTIKTHVSNILSKLEVTSRTEAVSVALQENLLDT